MEEHSIDEKKKNEILCCAENVLYYNNLLIDRCDSWLSAEEGNANMLKAFMEKRKKEARISKRNKINRALRFFGNEKTNYITNKKERK